MIKVKYVNGNKIVRPSTKLYKEINVLITNVRELFSEQDTISVRIQYSEKFADRHSRIIDVDLKTGIMKAWQTNGSTNPYDRYAWVSVPNIRRTIEEYGGTIEQGVTFTLAHELGHLYDFLTHPKIEWIRKNPQEREKYANEFALIHYGNYPQFQSHVEGYNT